LGCELPFHSQLFQIVVGGIAGVLCRLVQEVNVIADSFDLELDRSDIFLQRLLGGV
jgi:hypothetical protein